MTDRRLCCVTTESFLIGVEVIFASKLQLHFDRLGVRLGIVPYSTNSTRGIKLNSFGFEAFRYKLEFLKIDLNFEFTNIDLGLQIAYKCNCTLIFFTFSFFFSFGCFYLGFLYEELLYQTMTVVGQLGGDYIIVYKYCLYRVVCKKN